MNNTEKGYASGAHAKFGRTPMPACSEWNPFPSRAKKTSPLHSPDPSLGCGQPAPPLQCWWLRNTVLKQEWNDFFAPGNLSPFRSCLQPTLHRLGVRGCGAARMEGTFFSLGTDPAAMVLHCYVCVRVCETLAMTPTVFDPAAMVLHCYACARV